MELFPSLVYVSVAIALIASATGDETSQVGATECTLVLDEGKSANETIYNATEECFFEIGYEHMGRNPPDELIRTTIATFCGKIDKLRRCLQGVESNARACLGDADRTRYILYRNYMELDFEIGCEENGADVAEVYRANFYRENKLLNACQENATARAEDMDAGDANGFMLYTYKVMRDIVHCLETHRDVLPHPSWAVTMYTKGMDRMMCFKDGADVLCKTIVDANKTVDEGDN